MALKPGGGKWLRLFNIVFSHLLWTLHDIKPHLSKATPLRCQHHCSLSSEPMSTGISADVCATFKTAFSTWMVLEPCLVKTWISSSLFEHLEGAIHVKHPDANIVFTKSNKFWFGSNLPSNVSPPKRVACSWALARFSAIGRRLTVRCWPPDSLLTDCFRLAITRVVDSKYNLFRLANWPIVGAPPYIRPAKVSNWASVGGDCGDPTANARRLKLTIPWALSPVLIAPVGLNWSQRCSNSAMLSINDMDLKNARS